MMKTRALVGLVWIALLPVIGFVDQAWSQEQSQATSQNSLANPTFDFSGVDHFWRIVETLEQDQNPSPAQWDSLLRTPGYRALTASEFDPQFFVQCFTLAFKPSQENELQEAMKDPVKGRYLKYYQKVRDNKPELDQQQEKLRSEAIMTKAAENARRFLPADTPATEPPVAFVIFAFDGRGYEPIVIDLMASSMLGLDSFLAHESHHWYRNRLLSFDPDKLDAEDEYLVSTLNQIQAEGIADQIDKASWFDSGGSVPPLWQGYAERYKAVLAKTPGLISELDSLICEMSDASADMRQSYGEAIAELVPMSGHPTGFYMARLIAEEQGIDRLAEDVGNPFAFCRHYDEAARRSGGDVPTFSAKSLQFLASIESKYSSSPDS